MRRILLFFTLLQALIVSAQNYQFLGEYDDLGVPLYLSPNDVVSQETLDLVNSSLPESYPVPLYNPHYISSGYDTDIILNSTAEVWITFVKEGAGYKNVLGFYTYDVTNPPTAVPQPEDITIVFPNVSELNSGGGLTAGNKVSIGVFPPNTGIGFVLLANGWVNGQVTAGHWQLFSNPDYNPEADATLQHHNVLLTDPVNERILLGFEDIRRDYASCDNDFNDAIFYVTSNPYEAMRTVNVADVSSATDVSSANVGGLESNGDLASLIAKRNFVRTKTATANYLKANQNNYQPASMMAQPNNPSINLSTILPITGMFGTEQSYVSSPTDLLGITNAEEVFSVDYYIDTTRVSAVLATKTSNGIYDHTKTICDRLNGAILEDVRTVTLLGHQFIMIKVTQADGKVEYAVHFSVEDQNSSFLLHSYWNIADYPLANYYNFQVWGSTMSQVSSNVNHILNKFEEVAPLHSTTVVNRVPKVFVKSGFYEEGNLYLEIKNTVAATTLAFDGNLRTTELSQTNNITNNIALSSAIEQSVIVPTGSLFDIGFSLAVNNTSQPDVLYLADGPWGIDFVNGDSTINAFAIESNENTYTLDEYLIERNAQVSGSTLGTVNLFRTLLPGDMAFPTTGYNGITFTIASTTPVEVVAVQEGLTDWSNRYRFQLPANDTLTQVTIPFTSFENANNVAGEIARLKTIVFSVQGNYTTYEDFSLEVKDLALTTSQTLVVAPVSSSIKSASVQNIPNPFKNNTTILLPISYISVNVCLYDMLGRQILSKDYNNLNSAEIPLELHVPNGIYNAVITTNTTQQYHVKLAKQ